jgi:ATP-dependent Lhr-like helicase
MSLNAFEQLAPFIQEYIYQNKWIEMRDVQVAACDVVFNTEYNLLLASGTASGKTEAAFLPALTIIDRNPSSSVGILYISPLKALINDQFVRLSALCDNANITVTKWHGDVDQNRKNKFLQQPSGILQITPESLEAMLMRKPQVVIRFFSDLRFIIIDEVHHFMGNDRGAQLLCILERIQKLCYISPRRIGLSATLGDYSIAENWLSSGTLRTCVTPIISVKGTNVKLLLTYHDIKSSGQGRKQATKTEYYQNLFDLTKSKRCIVFSNAKSEVEENIAFLKAIAQSNKYPDVYYVHHGSISADLREYAEKIMKEGERCIVTGATLTLELGIDLGQMERIIQTGAPHSVSSLVQRLGRSGRRGSPAEMAFMFFSEEKDESRVFFHQINWPFIRTIAMLQLYLEDRWIEPIAVDSLPFGLLYHQTMSFLYSAGSALPSSLAENVLSMSPFSHILPDDYKILLRHMLETHQLERIENGEIIIGIEGERKVNHYDFFSVFETSKEFSVKCKSEEIGSVSVCFPVGSRFALAGLAWEVVAVDQDNSCIFVEPVKGISHNDWMGFQSVQHHTRVIQKMRDVLLSDADYAYLSPIAHEKLSFFRELAHNSGILHNNVVELSPNRVALFPWVGTKALNALLYALMQKGYKVEVVNEVTAIVSELENAHELELYLENIKSNPPNKEDLPIPDNVKPLMRGKFNEFIPNHLLRKQYIADYVDLIDLLHYL